MARTPCNNLTGREWLQNSFSIWRNLSKSADEKSLKHPASFPVALCEKVISTFSKSNAAVIDPFNGIGSTMVACSNLQRKGVGIDLSQDFCNLAKSRIDKKSDINVINGDNIGILSTLESESFDLCFTSPPYWDILNRKRSADMKENISYSSSSADIGNIADYDLFIKRLSAVFQKTKNLLKSGSYCVINVMDIRKKSVFYPLHSDLASELQKLGYIYDDLIIWDRQLDYNNMRPLGYPYKFRINKVHEYLLIFIKP